MDEVMNLDECYIKGEERNMEKRPCNAKEKVQPRHDGSGPEKDHHKHGSRDRLAMKPSRRPYDNFIESFTPFKLKHTDILFKIYYLKLILEPSRPKRANTIMGKDDSSWCSYH